MSDALENLQRRITDIAEGQIKTLFAKEFRSKARITVMVRFEDSPTYDVLVTGDNDEGIQAIVSRRTKKIPAKKAPLPTPEQILEIARKQSNSSYVHQDGRFLVAFAQDLLALYGAGGQHDPNR